MDVQITFGKSLLLSKPSTCSCSGYLGGGQVYLRSRPQRVAAERVRAKDLEQTDRRTADDWAREALRPV